MRLSHLDSKEWGRVPVEAGRLGIMTLIVTLKDGQIFILRGIEQFHHSHIDRILTLTSQEGTWMLSEVVDITHLPN